MSKQTGRSWMDGAEAAVCGRSAAGQLLYIPTAGTLSTVNIMGQGS